MKKQATIKDVARLAGVSLGTVSRVLNKADDVAPELVERTMSAIRETKYTSLRKNKKIKSADSKIRSKVIGMLYCASSTWMKNQLFAEYSAGIKAACRDLGYDLLFFMEEDFLREDFFSKTEGLAGMLAKLQFCSDDIYLDRINELAENIPVVGFGMSSPCCRFPQVSFDNYMAGSLAAEELISRGHRNIAFINHLTQHGMFVKRCHGYMEAMKRHNLWNNELLIEIADTYPLVEPEVEFPDFSIYLDKLLNINPRPTAVIVANDWGAGGFYMACIKRGIKIPEDFSVVGFDNNELVCKMLAPELSSMSNPLKQIGTLATRLLTSCIENRIDLEGCLPVVQYLPGELVERNSIKHIK